MNSFCIERQSINFIFRRKSQRLNETDEILLNNSVKYRKKLYAAYTQINRTKKFTQRNLDSPDWEIHGSYIKTCVSILNFINLVARLVNDIGQLSGCKSLQVCSSHAED